MQQTSNTIPTDYSVAGNSMSNTLYREEYLVDEEGFVNFPALGKVKIAGLGWPDHIYI